MNEEEREQQAVVVARRLLEWAASTLRARPDLRREALFGLQDDLLAFFVVAHGSLEEFLLEHCGKSIDAGRYFDIIAAIHASQCLMMWGPHGFVGLLEPAIHAIQQMYFRPEGFAEDWLKCLEWLLPTSEKNFHYAVPNKAYDAISKALGLRFDMHESLVWEVFGLGMAERSREALKNPEAFLARSAFLRSVSRDLLLDLGLPDTSLGPHEM